MLESDLVTQLTFASVTFCNVASQWTPGSGSGEREDKFMTTQDSLMDIEYMFAFCLAL